MKTMITTRNTAMHGGMPASVRLGGMMMKEREGIRLQKFSQDNRKKRYQNQGALVSCADASFTAGGQLMKNISANSLIFANRSMTSSRDPLVGG